MQRFLKTKVVGKMTLISGNKLNIILKITPIKKKEVVENYHNKGRFSFIHHEKDGCGGKSINTVGARFILWVFHIFY